MATHSQIADALLKDLCVLVPQLIRLLAKNKLVAHQSIPYDGFRLTAKGYDYLALKSLAKRGTVSALGIQIGVGKESDIFTIATADGTEVCNPALEA